METIRRLDDVVYHRNSVVTVGSFDGVHRAHQEIIREVVERGKARKGRSVVISFEPHPREIVGKRKGDVRLLTTLEERQTIFAEMGVDLFFVIAFDLEFSQQDSHEFYTKYLVDGTGVSEVIEGYDHHFGHDREGSIEAVLRLGKEFGFSIVVIKPVVVDGVTVSSSGIRNLLLEGDVEKAQRQIGRPYALGGVVVRGDSRGRDLGYPTANIKPASDKKLIPRDGIYFVKVRLHDEEKFGMASVGVRPTFHSNGTRIVEVNILDFERSIYGQEIQISFLKRLRDEQKFDSVEALIRQMDEDKRASLRLRAEFANSF